MTQVRILNGNVGNYTNGGGSWDEASPEEGTFLVELCQTPRVGEAVIFNNPSDDNILSIGPVESIVVTAAMVYVFLPVIQRVKGN